MFAERLSKPSAALHCKLAGFSCPEMTARIVRVRDCNLKPLVWKSSRWRQRNEQGTLMSASIGTPKPPVRNTEASPDRVLHRRFVITRRGAPGLGC
ncbi:hypothetical protein NDU88_012469 [Pleurodeles waltl]|uniref:Uncharacterized protein n=1 Tax=Pleurodeles waltl TaxID=8319 RepID=A0AAV7R5X4_PLEWA|nr:hypothetical protein NDU88_012469 [Pleurodeles waltl]